MGTAIRPNMPRSGIVSQGISMKPHIVKFSGGRSSGMMLIELLKQKALKPKRGDVILFNNTSAEHPATYEFTRKMKALAEEEHNIPFFWVEYQTYEDSSKRGWRRNSSYRLVNENPYSPNNKNGYHYNGEVFEEMVSLSGFLPNMLTRSCTLSLKIFITNSFLSDWLAQKPGIERLGHYGETSRITDEDVINTHKTHQGSTPDKILLAKRKFVRSRGFVRDDASWENFTKANLCFDNAKIKKSVIGNKGQLFGDHAIAYVSCLGIRKDEEIRVDKIRARIDSPKNEKGNSLFGQPSRETILAPLVDNDVAKQDVIDFWKKQKFDLDLPDSGAFSNCVYCPLKGKSRLLQIATMEMSKGPNGKGVESTPASIDWWIDMEKKYSRDLKAEERNVTSKKDINFIGFFGATKGLVYQQIKQQAKLNVCNSAENIKAEYLEDDSYIPCNCTD